MPVQHRVGLGVKVGDLLLTRTQSQHYMECVTEEAVSLFRSTTKTR